MSKIANLQDVINLLESVQVVDKVYSSEDLQNLVGEAVDVVYAYQTQIDNLKHDYVLKAVPAMADLRRREFEARQKGADNV